MDHWGTDVSGPEQQGVPARIPRHYKKMVPLTAKPNWPQAQKLKQFQGMRSAHFEVELTEQPQESFEVTFYIATESSKKKKKANLRVVMNQGPQGSRVRVFNAKGERVTGDVPMINEAHETSHAALLPWRDHTSMCYSLLIQTIEQQPHVVLIQHSRNRILKEGLFYRPAPVLDMLRTYRKAAPQLKLCERPHCYLDRIEHMRALPLPYTNQSYGLTLSEPLFVTWSAHGSAVQVAPR